MQRNNRQENNPFRNAVQLKKEGNYNSALILFKDLHRNWHVTINIAQCYLGKYEPDKALEHLRRAEQLKSNTDKQTYFTYIEFANYYKQKKDYPNALEYIKKIPDQMKDAQAWLTHAEILALSKPMQQSIPLFRKALNVCDNIYQKRHIYRQFIYFLAQRKEYDLAGSVEQEFTKSGYQRNLTEESIYSQIQLKINSSKQQHSDYFTLGSDDSKALERKIIAKPEQERTFSNWTTLGYIYCNQDRLDDAIAVYKKMLDQYKQPDQRRKIFHGLLFTLDKQENHELAIAVAGLYLNEGFTLTQKEFLSYAIRFHKNQQHQIALKMLHPLIYGMDSKTFKPEASIDELYYYAEILSKVMRYKDACSIYSHILNNYARTPDIWKTILPYAIALLNSNQAESALTLLKNSLTENTNWGKLVCAKVRTLLAIIYYDMDEYDLAFTEAETAIKLASNYGPGNYIMGMIMLSKNKPNIAKEYFENAKENTIATHYKEELPNSFLESLGATKIKRNIQGKSTPTLISTTSTTTSVHQQSKITHFDSINIRDRKGRTVLYKTLEKNNMPFFLSLLLMKKIKINLPDDKGLTPLHVAVRDNNLEAARELLNAGASINAQTLIGNTPLHYVFSNSKINIDMLNLLIDAVPDLKIQNNNKQLPLHLLLRHPQLKSLSQENVTYIIRGSNISSSESLNPLRYPIFANNIEVVQLLINLGAKINADVGHEKQAPIVWAASIGNLQILNLLIENRADLSGLSGEYAVKQALLNGHADCLQRLIIGGASPNVSIDPSQAAIGESTPAALEPIIKTPHNPSGDSKKSIYDKGDTPLHLAAKTNSMSLAETCLNADPTTFNAVNSKGKTPTHYAIKYLLTQMAQLIWETSKQLNACPQIPDINIPQQSENRSNTFFHQMASSGFTSRNDLLSFFTKKDYQLSKKQVAIQELKNEKLAARMGK